MSRLVKQGRPINGFLQCVSLAWIHDLQATTPVGELKRLPSSFWDQVERFLPTGRITVLQPQGEVTYSLAVLLFQTDSDWKRACDGHINSVMTRFIVDCRILHGESTPLGPLGRMSDTVIMVKGWTLCWETEMTHPYSFVPPCVYIKV